MNTTEIIRKLCALQGITVASLEVELGFSNGSLSKDGVSLRSDRLLAAAQRLGVSMEYLMGAGEVEQVPMFTIEEMEIIRKYRALDDRGKGAVENVLDREYRFCSNPQKDQTTNAV